MAKGGSGEERLKRERGRQVPIYERKRRSSCPSKHRMGRGGSVWLWKVSRKLHQAERREVRQRGQRYQARGGTALKTSMQGGDEEARDRPSGWLLGVAHEIELADAGTREATVQYPFPFTARQEEGVKESKGEPASRTRERLWGRLYGSTPGQAWAWLGRGGGERHGLCKAKLWVPTWLELYGDPRNAHANIT